MSPIPVPSLGQSCLSHLSDLVSALSRTASALRSAEARASSAEERLEAAETAHRDFREQAAADAQLARERITAAEALAGIAEKRAELAEGRASLAEELVRWVREELARGEGPLPPPADHLDGPAQAAA